MAIYSIYTFTNLVNGKVYVGKTVQNPTTRKAAHIRASRDGSQLVLHRAIRHYGSDNFKFQVIFHTFSSDDLSDFERYFIQELQSYIHNGMNKGYNMTLGGDGFDSDAATRLAKERVAKGTHNFQGEVGSINSAHVQKERVAKGTHPFQAKDDNDWILWASNRSHEANISRVANGTHHFLSSSHRNKLSKLVSDRTEQGVHHFQTAKAKDIVRQNNKRNGAVTRTCPHCQKTGNGNAMRQWHFDNCKFK